MLYMRPRTTCKLCPFAGRARIKSELVADGSPALLAIIGDFPGLEEVRDSRPFTSPYGKLLNWMLYQVNIRRSNVYLGYAVQCLPTKGSVLELQEAIPNCRAGLYDELNDLLRRGTKVTLALGPTVLQALGIEGKLETIRGSIYKVKLRDGEMIVIPTYAPSEIMSKTWKRSGGGTADRMVTWLADFKKAKRIIEDDAAALSPREIFNLEPTVEDVEEFVAKAISNGISVAVDTETTGISYDESQIVVIGLAISSEEALCVPILDKGGVPYWSDGEWERVYSALRMLFSQCKQYYQNCYFDVPRLRKMGFDLPYENIEHDSMLLHHTIAAEAPHDLGFIASVYGSTPYWKDDFKNRDCGILDMDQLTMRRYNLRDCVVLPQIIPPMLADLEELGLTDFYNEEVRPLIGPIMDMTQYGIGISLSRVEKYKINLQKKLEELEKQLRIIGGLPEEFNLTSDNQLRYFLYGIEPPNFKKIDEWLAKDQARDAALQEKIDKARGDRAELAAMPSTPARAKKLEKLDALIKKLETPKPTTKAEQEILDLAKIRATVKPIYMLPNFVPSTTDSGAAAVDKMAILSLRISLNNRLAAVREFKRKDGTAEEQAILRLLEWLDLLGQASLYEKLLSTYTKYQPWLDGRVHPYWKQHGTASGRLASSDPNLQNLPMPRDDANDIRNPIREFFVAKPGWKFVSSDYVNLEAQLLGFETQDPELCEVFAKGLNLHDVNTKSMFGNDPSDPQWSIKRKVAKIAFFACICYGGSPSAIYRKIMAEIPSLRMTLTEFAESIKTWMDNHPAYRTWEQAVRFMAREQRKVQTSFGRIRIFLGNDADIEKEALNHMIQSSGASLVNRATIRIWKELRARNMRAQLVLQVHDQLVIEAPDEEVEDVKELIVRELQRPFMFRGVERSIPCDCTVGDDFGKV